MKAMILAAGRGERMRPLTDHTPKPLLQVGGNALIEWHVERLAQAGYNDIVVNHAHLGSQIEAYLGNGANWGVSIQYSREATALETAGGIAYALPILGLEPFLVVNGDVYIEMDFASLRQSLSNNKLAHLVMVDNPPQHPKGDFAYDDGKLALIGDDMLTFSGVGVYHPDLFAGVVQGEPAKLAPLLKQAIAEDRLTAEHHVGIWHDIGTPERLTSLDQELRQKLFKHK